MNYVSIGAGIVAILYGIYSIFMRIKAPSSFGKLDTMKKFWGEKAGTMIHLVGYTIIPLIFGFIFVILGIKGKSIF